MLDDRRRMFRLTHDRESEVALARFFSEGGWRPTRKLLATAGDRLALEHIVCVTGDPEAPSEIEILELDEVDREGRFVAITLFDPQDRAAASAELFERCVANGADGMPAALIEYLRALNARDPRRVRAVLPDDFVFDDRRRTGLGRLEGADAFVPSLSAVWKLTREWRLDELYAVAVAPHARVAVWRTSSASAEGGEFESLFVELVRHEREQLRAIELFELENLEAALARFEELRPKR